MCGICGYLDRERARPEHELGVGRMMDALAHRGPDAAGRWRRDAAVLGHRRLAIIDLSPDGNQPLESEDGTLALVANGEIYNHAALRAELESRGHVFRSRSDSEVILHLYEERGADCVDALRGMFAFAIYDVRRRRLVAARDRLGEKPLYFSSVNGNFWFASELQALLAALPVRPEIDLDAIDRYLTLQYIPAPHTALRGVYKLPAAHRLTVEPGGAPRVERYWRLSFAPGPPVTEADAVAETRALVEEAVTLRMVADVPVGAFLSGGVDSSTVVALMARRARRPIETFSVDLPAGDGGEGAWARRVAAHVGTLHHEIVVEPRHARILPELVTRYGEPFADPSALPTFLVSQLARTRVTVALSGDAGDEGFAGYTRYAIDAGARLVEQLPRSLGRAIHAALARLPGGALRPLREYAAYERLPAVERYLYLVAQFAARDKLRLVGPALRERALAGVVARDFERILDESDATDGTNRLLDLDCRTYLPDDIFPKVDIASMAHALEVRAPLADHVLLERMARWPGALKLRRFRGKRLLRRAVRDLVPREVLTRRKRGFNLPLGRWMREELGDLAASLLGDRTTRERGLVDATEAQRLLDEHRAGVDHGERLWNLTVLELWCRHFVDGARPQDDARWRALGEDTRGAALGELGA